jgi:hypothetical protein
MIRRTKNADLTQTNPAKVTGRTFNTYAEANSYFLLQCKIYGQMAYRSTEEFKVLAPIMKNLWDAEGLVAVKAKRVMRSICISL